MSYIQTQAVVLKKSSYREDDRRAVFFTKDYGKISALVIGASKIKSKLAGHLEPFSVVELHLVNVSQMRVIGAECVKHFRGLHSSYDALQVAGKCMKLVDVLSRQNHPDQSIYNLLNMTLEVLDNPAYEQKLKRVHFIFIWKFLALLGYQPELYKCVSCKKELNSGGNGFSAKIGGVVCKACSQKTNGPDLSDNAIKYLRISLEDDMEHTLKIHVDANTLNEVIQTSKEFLVQRI